MKCPVDGTALLITERSGVEIDYCPQCRGVWLDRGELDKIIDRAADLAGGRQTSTAPIRARATTVLTATGIITVAPGVGGRKGSSVTSSTSDTKNLFLIAGLMTGLSAALANAGGAADGS
jgi:Zn-finger nucleic acid-binding protein